MIGKEKANINEVPGYKKSHLNLREILVGDDATEFFTQD